MRKCFVTHREFDNKNNRWGDAKTETGLFHEWGTNLDGEGNPESAGIVELPDGKIIMEYPGNIKFQIEDKRETSEDDDLHLSARIFTGDRDSVEMLLREFLGEKGINTKQIYKILQSEYGESITITILYYK